MGEKQPVSVGDKLYHNSAESVEHFYPEGVVYFGVTKNSVKCVGGSGFLNTFQVIGDLGPPDVYGGRGGWGKNHKWVSLPGETAAEALQHLSSDETD